MPFGARTALASQRNGQALRDFEDQIQKYEQLSANNEAYHTKKYKKELATSRSRMPEIAKKHQDIYNANREESIARMAELDKKEKKEKWESSTLGKISSMLRRTNNNTTTNTGGGSKSKEILGKQRRVYKVAGSRKEHVKYKGQLIPVSDYKKLMKLKR
jgi:hypothetical protein